jgi:hypothetical protein
VITTGVHPERGRHAGARLPIRRLLRRPRT